MPFTSKTFDFLMENRLRNSREWYQQNKETYQREVLAPMRELVVGLEPYAVQVDPEFITEPRVDRTISRVYRDTRFTRDKSLYREVQWVTFKRDRNLWPGCPSLYVEVSPDGVRFGCGWYAAEPSFMEGMRERILAGDPMFLQVRDFMESQDTFRLLGESYKRHRFPNAPQELWPWLDRKSIHISCDSWEPNRVFAPDLAQQVGEELVRLKPVYAFFLHCTQLERERRLSLREE